MSSYGALVLSYSELGNVVMFVTTVGTSQEVLVTGRTCSSRETMVTMVSEGSLS